MHLELVTIQIYDIIRVNEVEATEQNEWDDGESSRVVNKRRKDGCGFW